MTKSVSAALETSEIIESKNHQNVFSFKFISASRKIEVEA
jgi:hypothetical protein